MLLFIYLHLVSQTKAMAKQSNIIDETFALEVMFYRKQDLLSYIFKKRFGLSHASNV